MKRNNLCFIGICSPPRLKQSIKATLALAKGVYRVTDHGGHIKVNSAKPLPKIAGFHCLKVRDQTTHFDARYWDFTMDAFRYAVKKGHGSALGIMVHYLINVFGVPEVEFHEFAASSRRFLNASMTDEEAHGWEFPHIAKIRKQLAEGKR